jgi:hypothetical protein
MVHDDHPARANIQYLEQGVALIGRLADAQYAASPVGPFSGGVGAQFRHCLDFYDCFLQGLDAGEIDYRMRERDQRIETDRSHAVARTRSVCNALRLLTHDRMERVLRVRAEESGPASAEWAESSAGRELQFLTSHTIHHFALIALLLANQGFDVAREFPTLGVAPSTLEHWKEAGSVSRTGH